MGKRGPEQIADRTLLLTTAYPIYCDFWAVAKGERRAVLEKQVGNHSFYKGVNIPAEPDTLVALFEAKTVKQVRQICRTAELVQAERPVLAAEVQRAGGTAAARPGTVTGSRTRCARAQAKSRPVRPGQLGD